MALWSVIQGLYHKQCLKFLHFKRSPKKTLWLAWAGLQIQNDQIFQNCWSCRLEITLDINNVLFLLSWNHTGQENQLMFACLYKPRGLNRADSNGPEDFRGQVPAIRDLDKKTFKFVTTEALSTTFVSS